MDLNLQYGRNFLAQIVALFFSMAGMADAAARSSAHHRRSLLPILREAEIAGMRIAASNGLVDRAYFDTDFSDWDQSFEPEDAEALAASLRAIAIALAFIAQFIETSGKSSNGGPDPLRPLAALWLLSVLTDAVPARKVPVIDTS